MRRARFHCGVRPCNAREKSAPAEKNWNWTRLLVHWLLKTQWLGEPVIHAMHCKHAEKCEKTQNVQLGAIIAIDILQAITPSTFSTYASFEGGFCGNSTVNPCVVCLNSSL